MRRWGSGDDNALQQLVPLVHRELHRIAVVQMAGERPEHTLQATALVNETFLRLVEGSVVTLRDRIHFLSLCARIMRRILVDHARARHAGKRGGTIQPQALDDDMAIPDPRGDYVALDDALTSLAALDERKSRVVELRYFGGLTVEESAQALGVSPETVMRDWQFAKAWLQRQLRADAAS